MNINFIQGWSRTFRCCKLCRTRVYYSYTPAVFVPNILEKGDPISYTANRDIRQTFSGEQSYD